MLFIYFLILLICYTIIEESLGVINRISALEANYKELEELMMRLEDEVDWVEETSVLQEERILGFVQNINKKNINLMRQSYSILGRLSARLAEITKNIENLKKRVTELEDK